MLDLNAFQEYLNREEGFNYHNHIHFTVLKEGYCECEVELTPESLNPQGVAHGSLLFALCDCVTGAATASTDRGMLTQSATIHYLRPGTGTKLTARSRLLRNGKTTALCLGEVFDDEGRLVVTSEFEVFYTKDHVTMPGQEEPAEKAEEPQGGSADEEGPEDGPEGADRSFVLEELAWRDEMARQDPSIPSGDSFIFDDMPAQEEAAPLADDLFLDDLQEMEEGETSEDLLS